jgi:hypothetical protein
VAARLTGSAYLTAVADEIDMKRVDSIWRNHFLEAPLGSNASTPSRYQPQPYTHPEDMGIHWKDRTTQSKQKYASSRLGANTFERQEIGKGLLISEVIEPFQAEFSLLVLKVVEEKFYALGLYLG